MELMVSVPDPRGLSGGRRFTRTIRGVRADVAYLLRTQDGRRARDIWAVDVVSHDSMMPPRLYRVDAARGVITFETDHTIVTVVARAVRHPLSAYEAF